MAGEATPPPARITSQALDVLFKLEAGQIAGLLSLAYHYDSRSALLFDLREQNR